MKHLILITYLLVTLFVGHAQTNKVDSLIAKLDNEKLVGTCNYVWVLKNGCKEADTLINIGRTHKEVNKIITLKLFNLLTDPTKGIISHYILANIYFGEKITSGTIFFDDKDATLEYNYCGLRFYENIYRRMFSDTNELEHNKKVWSVLFRQIKLID